MGNINIKHLDKSFDTVEVFKDLNVEIDKGSFTVILGPSGCGKSTLLRMIAGLESVTDGSIEISKKDVTHLPGKDRDIAMVFQNYALYPHMTAYKNVEYGLKIAGVSKEERKKRVTAALATVDLEDQTDKLPSQMSGGQQQRVALARAIVKKPEVSEEEKERIEHSIIKGKEMMSSGFSVPHEPHSMDRRRDNHIHHALVNYSHQWMDNLTTKQQESISHLTSDGFIFLQGSLYPDHHDFFRHPSYSSIIDYDTISPDNISNDIMKKKREYSREITETVLDSFDNAPVLDNPVMSYRGTTIEELKDLIGDNEISHQELYDRAVTGEFHNSEVSDDSRIMNIPVSSSAHSDTASSFGSEVLLEIQRHTITSPVNVSAWGPAETEILTNPLSSYTIKDIYLKPSQENRELMVVQLEENI